MLVALLQLVSSDDGRLMPWHYFWLDPRRFALGGHTSKSILENHACVVNLFGCIGYCRHCSHRGGDGTIGPSTTTDDDGNDNNNVIGLAMDAPNVAFVLQNFPALCLYDVNEVEEAVQFLLLLMPGSSKFPSVAMITDRQVDRDNVDCECPMLRLFL